MTLRIGLLTHSVNPRGGVVHTLELARALHGLGHDVTVFAPALPGQKLFREVPFRVELVPAEATQDLHTLVTTRVAAFKKHIAALAYEDFDVWHSHDGIGGNALADLVDQGLIDNYVRTVHHLDTFADARVMQLQQRSYERAARVLCVSPLWCRTMQEKHGVQAHLVHNGVDLERFTSRASDADADVAARWGLRSGAPLWLAVGGVEARKNTVRSLQAFAEFRSKHPLAQLCIVGGASLLDHDQYQREFRDVLQATGLVIGGDVVLTGSVPDDDMPSLFRLADGLLMPSLNEGFGLVVLEALACGTPVVVSNIAPFTEYLAPHEASWADPLSSASIARAMHDTMARPPMPSTPPDVCVRHSWTASARLHERIYTAAEEVAHA